jgi:hypothetical protein
MVSFRLLVWLFARCRSSFAVRPTMFRWFFRFRCQIGEKADWRKRQVPETIFFLHKNHFENYKVLFPFSKSIVWFSKSPSRNRLYGRLTKTFFNGNNSLANGIWSLNRKLQLDFLNLPFEAYKIKYKSRFLLLTILWILFYFIFMFFM